MAGVYELKDCEEKLLKLAVQGMTTKQIANKSDMTADQVRKVFGKLYRRTGLKNLHHATAYYGNLMGIKGELLHRDVERESDLEGWDLPVQKGYAFEIGKLRFPASVISSSRERTIDIKCIVSGETYKVPTEFNTNIEELRSRELEKQIRDEKIVYERGGADLFVVDSIVPANEFYNPVKLVLRQTKYLTILAVNKNLTPELRQKYVVNPFLVSTNNPKLPLPIGVALHLIVGNPPHLIVCRRAENLGGLAGFYSSAVEGWSEADNDTAIMGGERVYDFMAAMERELGEERALRDLIGANSITVRNRLVNWIRTLSLIFNYLGLNYCLIGYLSIPSISPEAVVKATSEAKEGTYEMLPFPDQRNARNYELFERPLRNLCEHLINNPWSPAGIGIVQLLEKLVGKRRVASLLGERINIQAF